MYSLAEISSFGNNTKFEMLMAQGMFDVHCLFSKRLKIDNFGNIIDTMFEGLVHNNEMMNLRFNNSLMVKDPCS